MTEDRNALLERYRQMRTEFLAAINGLTEAQLIERSHNGWSVKDHMAHIAFWDELRATEVERMSEGFESAWRLTPEQDEVLNEMVTQARWDEAALPRRPRAGHARGARRVEVRRSRTHERPRGRARRLDPRMAGREGLLGLTAAVEDVLDEASERVPHLTCGQRVEGLDGLVAELAGGAP